MFFLKYPDLEPLFYDLGVFSKDLKPEPLFNYLGVFSKDPDQDLTSGICSKMGRVSNTDTNTKMIFQWHAFKCSSLVNIYFL